MLKFLAFPFNSFNFAYFAPSVNKPTHLRSCEYNCAYNVNETGIPLYSADDATGSYRLAFLLPTANRTKNNVGGVVLSFFACVLDV